MNISSSPLISPLLPTFYHKFPLSDRKNENPPLFLCLINHGLNKFHKKRTRHNTWQALFIGSNTKVSVPDLLHDLSEERRPAEGAADVRRGRV